MLMALLLGGVSCSKIDDNMKVIENRSICLGVDDIVATGAPWTSGFSFDLPTEAKNAKIVGFCSGGSVMDDGTGIAIDASYIQAWLRLTTKDAEKVGTIGSPIDLRLITPVNSEVNGLNIPIRSREQYDFYINTFYTGDTQIQLYVWFKVQYELDN
jgi:hypothetical protein